MRKKMSKKSVIASFAAIAASVAFLFGATQLSSAKAEGTVSPVAIWTLEAEGTDYTVTQHTMTEVCGISGTALQTDAMLWRQDTSASSDTSTNLIYSPSTALTAAGAYYAAHFTQNADKKIGIDVNTVVVKLYAHLTADRSAYDTSNGGIRLYAPDDTGEDNSGYMIPGNIVQNEWVELIISGEDLAELKDADGCFSGFTAGNAKIAGLLSNNGYGYADGNSWIAFDSFTGYSEYCVTFDDGVNKTSQFVAADTPITAPPAEKEGYTLLGWYDENGEKVDLTAGVKKSCTLTPKWQPTSGALKAADGNGYGDATQTNRKVQQVYGEALTVSDEMFWQSATDAIGGGAPSGYPIYSVSTNHVGASPTITFAGEGLSLKNEDGTWNSVVVRVYAHLTTDKSAYYTENGGIRLYGADDDGTNNSGYMLPADIAQDKWVDLEISGEYLADKNGDFSGFAVGSNVKGGASGEDGKKMYEGGSWSAEGAYVLFDTFTVGSYQGDEEIVSIYGTSLSVEDMIGLNIYVDKLTEKEVYMLVTTSNGEERIGYRDIKEGYYRYTIYVPAQDYVKEISFTFVDEDGSRSETYSYSIKAYAEQAKQDPSFDEKIIAVIEAMEDYATLAKAYFGGEQIDVPDTVKDVGNDVFDTYTYTVNKEGSTDGVSVKGITLIFNAEITLRLYCVFDEGVTASEIAVTVNGAAAEWKEKTIDGVKYHYVDCSGIAAAELDSVVTFKVGDCTISCSALSYAKVIIGNEVDDGALVDTLKALYLYHKACKTCFSA